MPRRCANTPKRDQPKTGELMSSIVRPLAGLEKVLRYDANTGLLYWTTYIYRIKKPGDLAGHHNTSGYIEIRYNRTSYQAHRIAWYLHTREDPGILQVEHIDTNRTNNKIDNLRLATAAQNNRNKNKKSGTRSQYKGVAFYNRYGKWISQIKVSRKNVYLGYFTDELEAHRAYCLAAVEMHGKFANFGENSPFNPTDRQFGVTPAEWHTHHPKRVYVA
jgi:hypothetical protein